MVESEDSVCKKTTGRRQREEPPEPDVTNTHQTLPPLSSVAELSRPFPTQTNAKMEVPGTTVRDWYLESSDLRPPRPV